MVLSSDRKTTHIVPRWQDIDVLQSLNQALSPPSDLTDILSGENYVTISALLPLMSLLNSKFLKEKDDTQLTIDIKNKVKTDLNDRLSSYNSNQLLLLQVSSFLDPRFKGKYLEDDEVEDVKIRLLLDLTKLTTASVESTSTQSNPATEEPTNPPPSKKRKLGTLFKDNEEESSSQPTCLSKEQQLQSQFESYSSVPRLDFEENPLDGGNVIVPLFLFLLHLLAATFVCALLVLLLNVYLVQRGTLYLLREVNYHLTKSTC